MNNKNIGNFIKELREEQNLTQEELAIKIPIGREAISKWERGINIPSAPNLEKLAEIFNISPEEIINGKKSSPNEKTNVSLKLYEANAKKDQRIKQLLSIIIVLILTIFFTYIINTFNTIKVYQIGGATKEIGVSNGILVMTKEKIYFNLGTITPSNNISFLKLYTKINNEERLIYKVDDTHIILYDYYGYNAYFDYDKINEIISNLYLDITLKDSEEAITIKLDVKKDFTNTKIFPKKETSITTGKPLDTNLEVTDERIIKIIENIKDIATFNGEVYYYTKNDIEVYYFNDDKIICIHKENQELLQEWNYYAATSYLNYDNYNNNESVSSFFCNTNKCQEHEAEIKEFYNILDNLPKAKNKK